MISPNVFFLDDDKILDDTIDWTQAENFGRYVAYARNLHLDNDLRSRLRRCMPRFQQVDASFSLHTRMPCKSPRAFGMNAALGSYRQNVDHMDSSQGFLLAFDAGRYVEEFWWDEASNVALAPFFERAKEEWTRLGDTEPCLTAVAMEIKIFINATNGGWSFEQPDCAVLQNEGITPRMTFEALL